MIRNINVHNYRLPFGDGRADHDFWKAHISSSLPELWIDAHINDVDVYRMDGEKGEFSAGTPNTRLVIFGNLAHKGATITEPGSPYFPHREHTLHLKDDNGFVCAEFDEEHGELLIMTDVFATTDTTVFDNIMKQFSALYFYPKTLENSWLHSQSKDKLVAGLSQTLREQRHSIINREKERIDNMKMQVNEWRSRIKQHMDNIDRSNKQVLVEEQKLGTDAKQIISDLDLIANLDKVKDVHIKDNKFIVFTNPLYCFTDNDERFYLGNMRIELNPDIADVRFFGDNPRRSYWTDHDPHPHVNGGSGEACLGNASTLIAELSNQMQLYPMVLTCIDFLEAANLEDVAGRQVYNWDQVDEEGNVIREGGPRETAFCNSCEEYVEELYDVYEGCDDDGPHDHRRVCDDCRDNYYDYDDELEVYIRS